MSTACNAESTRYQWIFWVVVPLILLAATIIVYFPSLHYEFQFDDIANIQKHFNIRNYTFFDLLFSGARWISYWLNAVYYSIGKFDPYYYRVGNVIIHSINGLLLFFMLGLGLTGLKKESFFKQYAYSLSFLTALLYMLHPVQTQTVSYVIQGQLEGMATLFMTAMCVCFLLMSRAQNLILKYSLMVLLFVITAFTCGTKEIAIVSPILLMLIDWFFVAQGEWSSFKNRIILHGIIFTMVLVTYVWLMKPQYFIDVFGFQRVVRNNIGNVITSSPQATITPYIYCISQFKVILHYIWIFIWPFGMSVEYDWKLCESFDSIDCSLPFLLLVALAAFVIYLWRKNKANLFIFSVVWFFVLVLPRSSIIPSNELMFDYKTYGASVGVLFLISAALLFTYKMIAKIKENKLRLNYKKYNISVRVFLFFTIGWTLFLCRTIVKTIKALQDVQFAYATNTLLVIALLSVLSFGSYERNKVWRSGVEFWEDIVKKAPGKARAWNNYGVELSTKQQKFEESLAYFKRAIAMDKQYPDPCNNLAVACANLGRIDDAINAVKRGLRIYPNYPEGHNNLGSFLLTKKDYAEAEKALNNALAIRPYYGKAWLNKGRCYLEQGREEEALNCLRNACTKGDLDNDFGFSSYGQVALKCRKFDEAIQAYETVKKLNPHYQDIDFNLANAYFLAERLDQAVTMYEALAQQNSTDFRIFYNLGEAYFKKAECEKALSWYEKAKMYEHMIPFVGVRIAECYDKLDRKDDARKKLESLVDSQTIPPDVKNKAQIALNQVKNGQPINLVNIAT